MAARNRTTYVLLLYLSSRTRIKVGSLGFITFEPGFYFYVGSGGTSFEKRLARHLTSHKKKFWHIDYLTSRVHPLGAVLIHSTQPLECRIARSLSQVMSEIPHFGCSDCRCRSHLFHLSRETIRR